MLGPLGYWYAHRDHRIQQTLSWKQTPRPALTTPQLDNSSTNSPCGTGQNWTVGCWPQSLQKKAHQIPWFNHLAEYLQPVGQQSLPASANNFSEYPSNGYHFDAQATRGGTHVCEVSIGVGKRALRSCEIHLRPQAKDLILAISNRHRKNQKPMMTHGLVLYKLYNAIECYWILLGLPKLEYISRTCYWAARSPMLSVETRNLILIILFVERVSEQWNEHALGSQTGVSQNGEYPKWQVQWW